MKIVTTKYVCDRCRKEFDTPPVISYAIGSIGAKDGIFRPKDLCRECADKLIKFMCEVEE